MIDLLDTLALIIMILGGLTAMFVGLVMHRIDIATFGVCITTLGLVWDFVRKAKQ